jgi:hypothetical protein
MMGNDQNRPKNAIRQQAHERLEHLRRKTDEQIDKILDRLEQDKVHGCKRIFSFEVLDRYLDCCQNGICPQIDQAHHNFLIDISVSGYFKQRAYYYSKDQIGKDNDDRYYMAVNKVETVFECKTDPDLNDDLFEQDLKELKSGEKAAGARRRKAFWRYMERTYNRKPGDPVSDFFNSKAFIDKVICNSSLENATLDEYMRQCKQSLDVVNGVDLYRFCHVRKLLSQHHNEENI